MKRTLVLGMILSVALLTGAGCTFKLAASSANILVSTDGGLEWQPRSQIIAGKDRAIELSGHEVTRIVFDTTNPDVMFFGAKESGLYGSNTAGQQWNHILPGQYASDIGLDPTAKCTLFVLTPIRLLKTTNCASTWEVMLNETRANVGLTVLTVDQFRPTVLYIASSVGDIFRSNDGGATWSVVKRFDNQNIRRLIIDPHDSSTLIAAMMSGSIYKSTNRGSTWREISEPLRQLSEREGISRGYRSFGLLAGRHRYFYASEDALFRSLDGGASWQRIPTLTPVGSSKIMAARPDSRATNVFYYATATTFYRTTDSGAHWVARPLPTANEPVVIAPHPTRKGVIFLGTRKAADQGGYWYDPPHY